ncbi:MAG: T9SS type A sorting domain-containing protein [bacterium]|nr:T9SS type A sorting domain-containing protein [bacterium]
MRFRLFCSLWILLLVPAAFGADVRLVYSGVVPNIRIAKHVEPILDASRQLEGFALSDTSKALRLIWLDGRPEDTIPLTAWPHRTINYRSDDTLYLYVYGERSENYDYSGTLPRVIRIAYTAGSWTINEVDPLLFNGVPWEEYVSDFPMSEALDFEYDNLGEVVGVVFQSRVYWNGYIFTIGSHAEIVGTSIVYTPDLSTRLLRTSNDIAIPGHFTTESEREYLTASVRYSYRDAWCDGCPPSVGDWATISIRDWTGVQQLAYARSSARYENIFVGNFAPEEPEDEVVIYGSTPIIDTFLPTQNHLICYNFVNGEREQVWYRPMEARFVQRHLYLRFYSRKLNVLIGTSNTSVFYLSGRTGELADSAAPVSYLATAQFYESELDSSKLELLTKSYDTVFIHQFDAITDAPEDRADLPSSFTLSQNYPNPFNSSTEIRFSLARASEVSVTVYNLLGQEVKRLVDGQVTAGEHRVTWDGTDRNGADCASGIYLCRLSTGNNEQCRKMVLLK